MKSFGLQGLMCAITGLSMAARAQAVQDRAEAEKVLPMPTPEEVRLFRDTPMVISVLDYTKGFGHTDLVIC